MSKEKRVITGGQEHARNRRGLLAFKDEKEFKEALSVALDDEYGVVLSHLELNQSAKNINQFLESFF